MKISFSIVVRILAVLFLSALPIFSQALRYNYDYVCNKERIVVGHCRRDSDQPGMPATKDEDNFCSVYYPDRPKRNGFEVQTVELRSDIVKKLESCGAFQARQSSTQQVGSQPAVKAAGTDPEVDAAEALLKQGVERSATDKPAANKMLDAAILKYKAAISRGSELYRAHVGLGVAYNTQGKYDLAIPVWQKSISLQPNNADDLNHLGITLVGVERFADAIAALAQAVRLSPKYALFHLTLGVAHLRASRLAEARRESTILSDLDHALEIKLASRMTPYLQPGNKCEDKPSAKGNGTPVNATTAPPTAAANSIAIAHYEKGKQFYKAEDYVKATAELEQAIANKLDKDRLGAAYV